MTNTNPYTKLFAMDDRGNKAWVERVAKQAGFEVVGYKTATRTVADRPDGEGQRAKLVEVFTIQWPKTLARNTSDEWIAGRIAKISEETGALLAGEIDNKRRKAKLIRQ